MCKLFQIITGLLIQHGMYLWKYCIMKKYIELIYKLKYASMNKFRDGVCPEHKRFVLNEAHFSLIHLLTRVRQFLRICFIRLFYNQGIVHKFVNFLPTKTFICLCGTIQNTLTRFYYLFLFRFVSSLNEILASCALNPKSCIIRCPTSAQRWELNKA